jgi:hypothetical protein
MYPPNRTWFHVWAMTHQLFAARVDSMKTAIHTESARESSKSPRNSRANCASASGDVQFSLASISIVVSELLTK